MQIMITNSAFARTKVLRFSRTQLLLAFAALLVGLTLVSGTVYHFVFLKAAREGWPLVSQVVRLVVRDEIAQRERFMRENLDAMAQKVGEMQAKLVKLEAIGERVSGAAGIKPEEMRQMLKPTTASTTLGQARGEGGPFVPARATTLEQLDQILGSLDAEADRRNDLFMLFEARLLESRMQALLVPTSRPVEVPTGSGFGFRTDPFTGQPALHTGLDFPAEVGTPVMAAAGGVVVLSESHPQYGKVVEIDHGNGLLTRYAHNSKVNVKSGDIVKRSQVIAEVGSTGRSTGPHLHFEVRVDGVSHDPAKFLAGHKSVSPDKLAGAKAERR